MLGVSKVLSNGVLEVNWMLVWVIFFKPPIAFLINRVSFHLALFPFLSTILLNAAMK